MLILLGIVDDEPPQKAEMIVNLAMAIDDEPPQKAEMIVNLAKYA